MSNPDRTNITGIHSSVVSIGSVEGGITNKVTTSGAPSDNRTKEDVLSLIEQLDSQLDNLPDSENAEKKTIRKRLQDIVDDLQQSDIDKERINFSVESLKKAASNIEAIAPSILGTALKIAGVISGLM